MPGPVVLNGGDWIMLGTPALIAGAWELQRRLDRANEKLDEMRRELTAWRDELDRDA